MIGMNEEKLIGYCVDCDDNVECVVKYDNAKCKIRGVEVSYLEKQIYCPNCGGKLFLYSVEKENLRRSYDEYKRIKGLLTSYEIIEIRNKYGLSQVDLARAIKVGKKNIARYELGAIQDACIDFLIRLLDAHPRWFGIKEKEEKHSRKAATV